VSGDLTRRVILLLHDYCLLGRATALIHAMDLNALPEQKAMGTKIAVKNWVPTIAAVSRSMVQYHVTTIDWEPKTKAASCRVQLEANSTAVPTNVRVAIC